VLAAVEAGCDAVDGALDAMSGLTSQPNLGSIAAALAGTERDPGCRHRRHARNLPTTGKACAATMRRSRPTSAPAPPTSTATRCPAASTPTCASRRAPWASAHRWPEVSRAYADVNRLFGDIVKVTPTSKVVGDMALFMVANDLSADDVEDPTRDVAFPESVVSLFKGELGRPPEGFPTTATSASCRRRCSSTAWRKARKSPWRSTPARRW
jgi:pyruvate carboxylase